MVSSSCSTTTSVLPLARKRSKVFSKVSKAEQAVTEGKLTETVIGEWNLQVQDLEVAASKCSRMTEWAVHGADGESIRAAQQS